MKKIILFVCVALGLSAQAQYFDHDYGSNNNELTQGGMNTRLNHEGFITSGISTNAAGTATGTFVSRADVNGNIVFLPYWIKGYRIKTPPPNNIAANSLDGKVLELNSTRFGIAGAMVGGPNRIPNLYYIETDTNGALIPGVPPTVYSSTSCSFYRLNAMSLAASGTAAIYLTGYAIESATGDNQVFVLKIGLNGALIWSRTYDIDQTVVSLDAGYDIVEDPSNGGLFVVGKTNYGGSNNGFMMRLNPANGNVVWMHVYGSPSYNEYFTTIAISHDPSHLGYILGGNTDSTMGGDLDGWLVRLDSSFTTVWTKTYDYRNISKDNYYADVIERLDSAGNYDIYAGGTSLSGFFGSSDMEVDKINSAGGNIAEFTYGNSNAGALAAIDKNSNGSVPGISMFGTKASGLVGNDDCTIFKAYFNGVTSCEYHIDTITPHTGPPFLTTYIPDTLHIFHSDTTTVNVSSGAEKAVCTSTSVSGGSNRMMTTTATVPELPSEMMIYNTSEMNNYLAVIEKAKAGNSEITVNDMYGRILFRKDIQLQDGENKIPIDLNSMNINSGIYIIRVTQGKMAQSKKVVVLK